MSINLPSVCRQLPLSPPPLLHHSPLSIRDHHRTWKRRRLKSTRPPLLLHCHLSSSAFETLYHSLTSHIPSLTSNSLLTLAPALGFASGVALYLSQPQKVIKNSDNSKNSITNIGDWILFTSPTPFNRFVILRCPSICFEGSELLEDVNERLVKEDRHFVRLNSGRIQVREGRESERRDEKKLVYQRVCVRTEDGGVISLDWPANLDLEEERGLDTTVVIVPGTTEGSGAKCIKDFVRECLRRGCFPVVMNPRGCAGSPLTTARLFTAADSDDVSTAIQYIKKARPWTTLMAVGWGYGANMLTKYLGEVGERTPLTAATCINNPFDLEEATRSSPHHIAFDQNLTDGLIDILRSNKELFQGRVKQFDVEKALSSKSIRVFEKAISMVSYGFDALEDFYAKSSTRHVVGKVKIPTLFIQNDDGSVPLFSVPRSLIAENPFTSLLLCSCPLSTKFTSSRLTLYWCQHLTIEWLTAVELGFLKGRHPLLKDVDVTINPSTGFMLLDSRASGSKSRRGEKLLNFLKSNSSDGQSLVPSQEMLEETDTVANIYPSSTQSSKGLSQVESKRMYEENNSLLHKSNPIDAETVEEEVYPADTDRGQVQQTAQVVINMLDVTMPDILADDQKEKVLTAVGQGESLMKALQDAVPENVREKLTSAVSGILHRQSSNLKFDGLLCQGVVPDVASHLKPQVQEKVKPTNEEGTNEDSNSSSQMRKSEDLVDVNQPTTGSSESELQASENLQNLTSTEQLQLKKINGNDTPASEDIDVLGDNGSGADDKQKNVEHSEECGPETLPNPESSQSEGVDENHDSSTEKHKVMPDDGRNEQDIEDENANQQNEESIADSSADKNKTTSSTQLEDKSSHPTSSSETQLVNTESIENRKKDDNNTQINLNNSSSPSFSVSQALDALTGIDDSTQVAVNSVFNVIEDVINHLEDERNNKTEDKNDKNGEELKTGSASNDHLEHKGGTMHPTDNISSFNQLESDERSTLDPVKYGGNIAQEFATKNSMDEDVETKRHPINGKLPSEKSVIHLNSTPQNSSLSISANGNPLYKEHLRGSLMSNIGNTESLDLDSTAALFLEYFPEEGQWKLLEQRDNRSDSMDIATDGASTRVPLEEDSDIIEPSYVISDVKNHDADEDWEVMGEINTNIDVNDNAFPSVKRVILDMLKVEVGRRLSASDMQEMESQLSRDMDHVANAVYLALQDEEALPITKGVDNSSEEVGIILGEHITRAVSSAVMKTDYLRRVLPVGVIVGSCLAAVKKYVNVAAVENNTEKEDLSTDQVKTGNSNETDNVLLEKVNLKYGVDKSGNKDDLKADTRTSNRNAAMVGAVTAALGASALLVHQQDDGNIGGSSQPFKEKENHLKEPSNPEEEISEKTHTSLVTSLAEKAMSVAGPVVPTKEDGAVDQERLVAMLAELGQKGGILRLFGKIALLWGGIRGAMSLTDKLISFLHIAERPLYQRILGFICMVLVLWSPVVVPMLPTLLQSWTTRSSPKIAELCCIIGLYVSTLILITLWGKRIRGYEKPLEQYGLDLNSTTKVQNFLRGLIGGVILVLLIQSLNFTLGCVNIHWPSALSSSSALGALTWLKVYGKMLVLVVRGFATATGVSLVEELLFRSWLPDEIAIDLGNHRGIIISGLLFSLFQRSPLAIPGLWLLSLSLAGTRERSKGQLWLPVGLRAGILGSSFILQRGGFLTYQPNFPLWITGTHPFQPFSGVTGITVSLVLALILYPRQPRHSKKLTRIIRE